MKRVYYENDVAMSDSKLARCYKNGGYTMHRSSIELIQEAAALCNDDGVKASLSFCRANLRAFVGDPKNYEFTASPCGYCEDCEHFDMMNDPPDIEDYDELGDAYEQARSAACREDEDERLFKCVEDLKMRIRTLKSPRYFVVTSFSDDFIHFRSTDEEPFEIHGRKKLVDEIPTWFGYFTGDPRSNYATSDFKLDRIITDVFLIKEGPSAINELNYRTFLSIVDKSNLVQTAAPHLIREMLGVSSVGELKEDEEE